MRFQGLQTKIVCSAACTSSTRRREILLPEAPSSHPTRPIRSENRALLIASIAKGRQWLKMRARLRPLVDNDPRAEIAEMPNLNGANLTNAELN